MNIYCIWQEEAMNEIKVGNKFYQWAKLHTNELSSLLPKPKNWASVAHLLPYREIIRDMQTIPKQETARSVGPPGPHGQSNPFTTNYPPQTHFLSLSLSIWIDTSPNLTSSRFRRAPPLSTRGAGGQNLLKIVFLTHSHLIIYLSSHVGPLEGNLPGSAAQPPTDQEKLTLTG